MYNIKEPFFIPNPRFKERKIRDGVYELHHVESFSQHTATRRKIPLIRGNNQPDIQYFEIHIKKMSFLGYVCIGISKIQKLKDRMPGWDPSSFGYHSDNGFLYKESGNGVLAAQPFKENDIVGCGLHKNEVFFTLNGNIVAHPFHIEDDETYYPTIGLCCEVLINVHFEPPFKFNTSNIRETIDHLVIPEVSFDHYLLEAASQGNVEALYQLGETYLFGHSVKKDVDKAKHCFFLAADKGHARAQASLGYMHEAGIGFENNYAEAVRWYEKAAEKGCVSSTVWLGYLYYIGGYQLNKDFAKAKKYLDIGVNKYDNATAYCVLSYLYYGGYGVPRDYVKAKELAEIAANRDHPAALYKLASMYLNGEGVPLPDAKKAVELFEKSAKLNFENAQYKLGKFYKNGEHVQKDLLKAYYWMEKAAKNEFGDAKEELKQILNEYKNLKEQNFQNLLFKNCKYKNFIDIAL